MWWPHSCAYSEGHPSRKCGRGMGQTDEPCGDLSCARAEMGPVGLQSSPEEVRGEERDLGP